MPKRKRNATRSGYPIHNYQGYTTDREHCPKCGDKGVALLGPLKSGQHIGICHNCAENYIVEPMPDPSREGEKCVNLGTQFGVRHTT